MKRIMIFLMSFFLIFASGCGKASVNQGREAQQEQGNTAQEKDAIPAIDFELSTLKGETVKLSDLKGKDVVLNFFTTTCPYCIKEMPWFIKTAEKYKDVAFLFIDSGEGKKAVNALIEDKKYKIDPLLDETGDVFYNYGLRGVPSSVFVDKNSNIYTIHTGLLQEDDLKSTLDEMINK